KKKKKKKKKTMGPKEEKKPSSNIRINQPRSQEKKETPRRGTVMVLSADHAPSSGRTPHACC
ncbi:hypothetical protein GT021_22380, partial [Streptomyces sp. SID5470]|nr:hypothetical protein [Streptomyces sp. SID5470]